MVAQRGEVSGCSAYRGHRLAEAGVGRCDRRSKAKQAAKYVPPLFGCFAVNLCRRSLEDDDVRQSRLTAPLPFFRTSCTVKRRPSVSLERRGNGPSTRLWQQCPKENCWRTSRGNPARSTFSLPSSSTSTASTPTRKFGRIQDPPFSS